MITKKGSAWKNRLATMTPAEAEAYKKADNARVAAYRAARKLKKEAEKNGTPVPISEPRHRESARGVVADATNVQRVAATTESSVDDSIDVPANRSLFTQYVGIGCKREWNIRPYATPFHRSDFMNFDLRPTDDVRDIPRVPFSVGERLHERARLYRSERLNRYVFLGVDDRAEEAARKFVRDLERIAKQEADDEAARATEAGEARRKRA